MCPILLIMWTAFQSFIMRHNNTVISLASVSSESHNLQRISLRIYHTKGESLCQAFLAETMETGNKNRCVMEATHVLRRKLRKDQI